MMRSGGDRLYARLTGHGTAHGAELFDLHLIACMVAIATQEAHGGIAPLTAGLGLESWEVRALFLLMFPGAITEIDGMDMTPAPPEEDEHALRDVLWYNCARGDTFGRLLVRIVARRCQRPNHLWQDLGLGSRRELSLLMQKHFPALAERNVNDMKWKKFFYRAICSSTGFSLCPAPVCSECDDFEDCFGAEDGESILAQIRNDRPLSRGAGA
jgi:nitrogen fixation protein NifQ